MNMADELEFSKTDKRALLAELLRKKAAKPRPAPLSFAQQRLWFLNELDPGSGYYNISRAARLVGRLDQAALQVALDTVVARHEALRANFQPTASEPIQIIHPARPIELEVIDLSAFAGYDNFHEAQRLASRAARQGFDLSTDRLLRATLFRLGDEDQVLLLVMHHIISDGWSMGILFRELAACYEAAATGQSPSLPALAVQYSDFASWQRQWLQGDVLVEQLGYWRQRLDGAPALLELPTDRPRRAVQSFNGAYYLASAPSELSDQLKELGRREGATLFMTLLAAFQTLLFRYTHQEDVVVGTPIANRNRAETEDVVGLFVNTLVMRSNLGGNPSFRELLGRVRGLALDAYAHQDLPFEKLVEELQPERSLSRMPLFQVLFALQNVPKTQLGLPGLELKEFDFDKKLSKLDLSLYVGETAAGLSLSFEYNTDLFDTETIEQFARHFLALLREIVAQADQPISQLQILTPADRQQILVDWNSARSEASPIEPIHLLFEREAERNPDAVAAVFEGQRLTYAELNRRANQLANYLRAHEVMTGTRVGLLLPRSLELIVGMLATLKAGAAYVPLDPDYPRERLQFMARDAGLKIILSLRPGESVLADDAQVISLTAEKEKIDLESGENPGPARKPDLAYVIYTSGSTGQPKGVMISHQSVVHLLTSTRAKLGFREGDVWTVVHSSAFDFSVWEIWGCLLQGGRLVIVPREVAQSPVELYALLQAERVTVLNQTPSSLRQLLDTRSELSNAQGEWQVRLIVCGGDALDRDLALRLGGLGIPVWNFYGPTENTVWTTCGLVERTPVCSHLAATQTRTTSQPGNRSDEIILPSAHYFSSANNQSPTAEQTGIRSTIGRPIPDIEVYLLDDYLQPVPVGVSGEILIGGAGLARGYLQRPDLTAERFIPHPFSKAPGARLYRSGDLARYHRDGTIEFLGRADHQIKLRGFRIELGEIETALNRHARVQQAVVLIREEQPGDQRLVAFVVPDDGVDGKQRGEAPAPPYPTPAELRSYLQRWLPEYMVPSSFVMMKTLPLTGNKKVDRLTLASYVTNGEAATSIPSVPQTPTEEIVANIWGAVLGIERVSPSDNFFLVGGHSLLATQVVSRLRSVFQVELPLRVLFQHPTVGGLAEQIDEALRTGRNVAQPRLVPISRAAEVPASFAQQRLWFLDQLEPGGSSYNIARAVRLQGPLRIPELNQALHGLIARHETLRTSFRAVDGEPVQVISASEAIDFELVDLSGMARGEAEEQAREIAAQASRSPFDISRGPLLRASVIRLDAEDHVLLLVTHHIVSDGWSMGILFRELGALYNAQVEGRSDSLPELPIQYADFALWQRDWLKGEALQDELNYWREQLSGAPELLALPTDRARPRRQSHNGGFVSRQLSESLRSSLTKLARGEGCTLFMTMLAAFATLLTRYSGQEDVVVGTPIANRTVRETEGLIGYFANTLVLRTDTSGNPTFRELLTRVRKVALDAYSHQDVPFERIVEELQPARSLSHNPLVQVLFALQNIPRTAFELEELTAADFSFDRKTSTLDLSLYVRETGEGLATWFEFNTDLFDKATIERLAGHYETLLRHVAAEPDGAIHLLPLLSDVEQQQILGGTSVPPVNGAHRQDADATMLAHELFERHAARNPEAIAAVFAEQKISYTELNRLANRWANYLSRHGVGPDDVIAIYAERSLDMIVAMLAILKAGSAYLPIDSSYPRERIAFMLADAKVKFVLTQTALVNDLPDRGVQTFLLDDHRLIAGESEENPGSRIAAENLAYVIYTSGSTGRPKGVAVSHSSVVHLFSATTPKFGFDSADVWTNAHSYAFDFSVWEIFGALLSGGRLVIVPKQVAQAPVEFLNLIREEGVTILGQTPSALRQLVEARRAAAGAGWSLRMVTCGGEALPADLIGDLLDWQVPVWNFFGPTEATVWVSAREVESADSQYQYAPLGGPLANIEMYLLDEHLQLVPLGVPGELYLGGEGLARGYLNNPSLTAARFVPHPFATAPGKRLYRTGDVARYRSEGTFEFVGRSDHQVKVRGFRIELGEIEAVLARHPAVKQSVVVVHDQPPPSMLTAYVVAGDTEPAESELRNFLKRELPDYMVPASFVMLDALPLNSSGKIDRSKLPAPGPAQRPVSATFVAPRTQMEADLAKIWSTVLKRTEIGVTDNFFELGGHSLLATQLLSRVRAQFNIEVPLRLLFESPTISGLAAGITERRPESTHLAAPSIKRRSRRDDPRARVSNLSNDEVDALLKELQVKSQK
jgi:amino acid adenylation domain-containing protein